METLAPLRHGHLAAALFDTGRLSAPASSRHWRVARDGDPIGSALYRRYYSARRYADGRRPALFVGPGEKLVLIAHDDDALFVWRHFIDASGQTGVNCAVFRNESTELSSELIADAEPFAWRCWPGQRLYTYGEQVVVRAVVVVTQSSVSDNGVSEVVDARTP